MSQVTVTNYCTDPSGAVGVGWQSLAGTGGTAAMTDNATGGAFGTTFKRTTWSHATTAVSGGFSYTCGGLSASTAYAIQLWVQSSKAQSVQLSVAFETIGGTTVNTVTSGTVVLVANTWTQLTVTGTSGAAVTQAVLSAQAVTGGSNWAIGDTFDGDAACVQTGSVVGPYFDGSFTSDQLDAYAWTGTANASTSTWTAYTPELDLSVSTTSEAPACVFTILDVGVYTQTVTVQRQVGPDLWTVPGWVARSVFGSDSDLDWTPPTNATITYTALVNGSPIATNTITIPSTVGWIQDPLDPTNAYPVVPNRPSNGSVGAGAEVASSMTYKSQANLVPIIGDPYPVALAGTRQAASATPFPMYTGTAADTAGFRSLTGPHGAPILVFRPPPNVMPQLPSLCYLVADVTEQPVDVMVGGSLTRWLITGNLVAAVVRAAVTGKSTYADVQALLSSETYGSVQTKAAATSYLDWLQNPLIFGTL